MLKLEKLKELNADPDRRYAAAIVDGTRRVTWADLEARTRALSAALAARGWRRVAFLSENSAALVILLGACSSAGVTVVGIDYTAPEEQRLGAALALGADAIIGSARHEAAATGLARRCGIPVASLDALIWEAEHAPLPLAVPPPSRPFESLSFTSGTTGQAKVVHRSKPFDARRFADLRERYGFGGHDVFIATLPFFHVSVTGWARMFLGFGATLVLTDVESPAAIVRDVIRLGVTAMLVTPPTLQRFLDELARQKATAPLTFAIVGGKVFPPSLKFRAIEALGPVVHEYYGTTETGLNVIADSRDLVEHPDSCGRVFSGSKVRIVDAAGRPLLDGAVGRVAIHGYQNMDGYLNGQAAETTVIDGETYLLTADAGTMIGDRLRLRNRAFDAATPHDLYSIEEELRGIVGVRDVFALAVAAERVSLYIVAPEAEARARVSEGVSQLRARPSAVELEHRFVPEIPYSLSGKVRVGALQGAPADETPSTLSGGLT
jgi:acyl-CoA synthetase (AMP-forming)/AMP-acid ligase II